MVASDLRVVGWNGRGRDRLRTYDERRSKDLILLLIE